MKYIVPLCFLLIFILVGCRNNHVEETDHMKATPKIELNNETREKLFVLPNYKNGSVTYSDTPFNKGMLKKEVLDTYGKPETQFKTKDRTYEVYGNVGLYYEEDKINDVVYYANRDKNSVIDTLGEPDREEDNNGLYEISYLLREMDKEETHLILWSRDDKTIGPITIEVLDNKEKTSSTKNEKDKKNPQSEDEAVEQFMESYIDDLMSFYNDKKDKIESIEPGSQAQDKVQKNKESGNFKNQESLDVRLIKYTYYNDDYDVTIERDYKYNSSNNKTSVVSYKLKKVGETFKVIDFNEE